MSLRTRGEVGNNRVPVFLYEMERLQKLSVSSLAKRTATLLSKGFRRFIVSSHSGPLDFDRFDALTCSSALAPELRTAFAAIRRFIIRQDHSRLDISMANLMQRSDGELILADPVCDDYLLSQTCYYY